jgi:phage protein D
MPQFYVRNPGLIQNQAQNQAQNLATLAGAFQLQVEVDIPGDVTINPSMGLTLTGTGTAWDTTYFIDTVTHEFSFEGGFRTTIEGKTGNGSDGL